MAGSNKDGLLQPRCCVADTRGWPPDYAWFTQKQFDA
jgi:hypothetical protein